MRDRDTSIEGDADQHGNNSSASNLEQGSGLKNWLWWLAGMTAISVILVVAFFLNEIDNGMYLVMGLLGFGLIYKGFLDATFIHNETKLASEQVRILEKVDDFESFFQEAKQSVFKSHIEHLYTISLAHHEIAQDNLIEIIHTRLMARNRLTELFSSILITLGLIGTIIGLVVMMEGLTEVLKIGDSGDLLSLLADPDGGPLNGLGTAFFTTLLGAVLGGVILRVLTSVVDANIMRYTSHLAELTEVYVLPHLRNTALENKL